MRTLRLRSQRGQAAVELSLMCIVIIPTFLYIIFIDDMLRFKQDQQETMISTAFDFTVMNWDHQTNKSKEYIPGNSVSNAGTHEAAATLYNRAAFSDHTASTPRFEDQRSDNETHHTATGAHECWLVTDGSVPVGGHQVTCEQRVPLIAAKFNPDTTINGRTRLRDWVMPGTGGLYGCKGRMGVINNFLPSGNLWGFSKEELTRTKFHGKYSDNGAIDFDGKGSHSYRQSSEAYWFPEDNFSIVAHPWAMTDQDDVSPRNSLRFPDDTGGPALEDRVVQVYNSIGPLAAITSATIYPAKAIQQQLISPAVIVDEHIPAVVSGDLMLTPEVAFRKAYAPQVGNFYASQYVDFNANKVQNHYNARGTWYMGGTAIPP